MNSYMYMYHIFLVRYMYNICTDFNILNAYLVFYWQITDSVYQSSSWITSPAWPPFVSGIAVGSLQIPVVLVIGDTLGIKYQYILISWITY